MIKLGPLNRRAALYANNPVKGTGGAVKNVLTLLKSALPVTVGKVGGTPVMQALRDATEAKSVFTTRYFSNVARGQVLVFEGQSYRVESFNVLGRREGLELHTEITK